MTVVGAVLVGMSGPSVWTAGSASAALIEQGTFHDEYSQLSEDYCDVPGLTVAEAGVADGRYRINSHGPDGLVYNFDHADFTDTATNLANGETVTSVGSYNGGDHRITDNGDGTLTYRVKFMGNIVWYNENGERIAQNTGQTVVEFLFDNAGTPTDQSDDQLLRRIGIVKQTGRTDDVCAAVVAEIG